MAEPLADQIMEKIAQAAGLYYRLILLVAPAAAGKTAALREVGRRIGAPVLNVNLELSRRLLELTERQRILQLPRLLADLIDTPPYEVVLLDNVEVLFDVALKQDPLRLFQGLSRDKTIVVAWNGSIKNEHLTYATPDHPEYRQYPLSDFLFVQPEAKQ